MPFYKVLETTISTYYVCADDEQQAERYVMRPREEHKPFLIETRVKTVCEGEWQELHPFTFVAYDKENQIHIRHVMAPGREYAEDMYEQAFDWHPGHFKHFRLEDGHVKVAPGELKPIITP